MKINKEKLKEMIREELQQETNKLTKTSRTAHLKNLRRQSGSTRAGAASGIAAQEVDVAAALEEIMGLLNGPGNQASGQIRPLVGRLLKLVQAQSKEPTETGTPEDTGNPQ
jgi:hypothetical protein